MDHSRSQPDLGSLIYTLPFVAVALLFGSFLYGAMRPTVLPNPGLSAYSAPRLDPIVVRSGHLADDMPSNSSSIAMAQEENKRLGFDDSTTIREPMAHPSDPQARATNPPQQQLRRQSRRRNEAREPVPFRPFQDQHTTGFWFR